MAAETTAGEAIDLDGISTAAGAAASPGATTHGPSVEVLCEGAQCNVDMGNAAEAQAATAAAAAGVRPPKSSNWSAMSKMQKRNWFQRHGEWNAN